MVTVCAAASSVGVYDQLQVPAAFVPDLVTLPIEALRVTVSPALASDQVPVLVASEPSLTVTEAGASTAITGGELVAATTRSANPYKLRRLLKLVAFELI